MSKHTAGPWELDQGEVTGTFIVYQDGSQDAIATVWDNYSEKENDANARLCAAAPDLLTAAEGAIRRCRRCQGTNAPYRWVPEPPPGARDVLTPCPECSPLRAALAKARGEQE